MAYNLSLCIHDLLNVPTIIKDGPLEKRWVGWEIFSLHDSFVSPSLEQDFFLWLTLFFLFPRREKITSSFPGPFPYPAPPARRENILAGGAG